MKNYLLPSKILNETQNKIIFCKTYQNLFVIIEIGKHLSLDIIENRMNYKIDSIILLFIKSGAFGEMRILKNYSTKYFEFIHQKIYSIEN